jgi:hypothetical protein
MSWLLRGDASLVFSIVLLRGRVQTAAVAADLTRLALDATLIEQWPANVQAALDE